jgi:hypothetical protein
MKLRFVISFSLLTGTFWGQIDTRISPAPAPVVNAESESTSKWTGAPLTGFLSEALGSGLKEGLETSLAVSEAASNQTSGTGSNPSNVDEISRVTGTLSLHRESSRASVLMQYAGGSDNFVKNSYLNDQFHQFGATEALKLSRWNLSLGERFNYMPQSNFGFDPAHVIGSGVATGDGADAAGPDAFLPANVIERMVSTQASAEYLLGARSSVAFSGAFSDLHFSGASPGLLLANSQSFTAGAQYSYTLNGKNTIGGGYAFSQGRALGFGSLIQTHSVQATYTRKIGKHLTLQAGAGPQFTTFNQNGIETTLGASTSVSASATYQLGRASFGASYFRGTNPNSGFFLGSQASDVRGFVQRQVGRSLQISVAGGYSRNENLGIASINAAQQIDSTYVTATVERSFGTMVSAFASYSLQNQDTNAAFCSAAGCTQFPMFHSGTLGLRFHIHPLTLRP